MTAHNTFLKIKNYNIYWLREYQFILDEKNIYYSVAKKIVV